MRIKDFIQDMQFQAKRVDQRLDKIPRYYYWVFGGFFPAIIFTSIPSLSGSFFTIHATGLTWFFAFSVVTAATTFLFVCCSVLILMFGILLILVIKDNREKIVGIKKAIVDILTSKGTKTDPDSVVTSENLRNVMREELEEILKKYGIILDKPTKQAFSEIFVRLKDVEEQNKSFKKEIQRLTKLMTKTQNPEKKSWWFWK